MDANTVTAVSATGVAVVSLIVSITEARSAREHNRNSVRPLLELRTVRQPDHLTGIWLFNYGLGPAIITGSAVSVDGQALGSWHEDDINELRNSLPVRPSAVTFRDGQAVPPGYQAALLALRNYDREQHGWFWQLLRQRITLEIRYESLYGEQFTIDFGRSP